MVRSRPRGTPRPPCRPQPPVVLSHQAGVDRGQDRERAVSEGADGEDGVAVGTRERQRIDVEGDVGRAGRADLEVVLALGQVKVAGGGRVGEVLDHHVATVDRDIHGGRVSAVVDDAHLRDAILRVGLVDQDLGLDGGEGVGRGDRGHGASGEVEVDRADDRAVGRISTCGNDFDGVRATGDLEVLREHAEGDLGEDGATVGVDVDRGRIRAEVPDTHLGHVGHVVLGGDADRQDRDGSEGGGCTDDR